MNLESVYGLKCARVSDINEHLPTLKQYASECDHVTEMGVRKIVSTYGLLAGRPKKMISIDLRHPITMGGDFELLIKIATEAEVDFSFIRANTREIDIEETDLLFIDTYHSYEQLKIELAKHGSKARKYIILHDTATFGYVDMNGFGRGLMPALDEFLVTNPEWCIKEQFDNNNGLTVVARI